MNKIRGCEPQVGTDCVRSSTPVSQTTASSPGRYPAPLSRQERDRIRSLIDEAKRAELRTHQARLEQGKSLARRRSAWSRYYWTHRDEILARRAERKQAA